jgi:hypothetical protein
MINEYGAIGGLKINKLVSRGSQNTINVKTIIPFAPYRGHLFYVSSGATLFYL